MFGILSQSVGVSSCSSRSCSKATAKTWSMRGTRPDERVLTRSDWNGVIRWARDGICHA
jgi:hypothetical protein